MTRLTRRGVAVLAGAVVVFTAGQLLRYPLLLALSAAGAGAVLGALVVINRRPAVTIVRDVYPDRVQRGSPAVAQVRVHNSARRWQAGFTAGDAVGASFHAVTVRSLPPGAEATYRYDLPTDVRGRHEVGPLTLDRFDPLGLGRARLTTGDTATLWVHPRVHSMRPVAGGHPRHHHEGRSTDESLHGSFDLRDVREYVIGDEVRHLHWKASAHTGRLMVRDFVDPDQPRFTALLDTRLAGPVFEEAVDLTASLVVSAATAEHHCRLVSASGLDVRTTGGAAAARRMLDELCLLAAAADAGLPLVPGALTGFGGGSLAVVTAGLSAADRAALAALRSRFSPVVVIVLGGATAAVPAAKVLSARDAADAARRWNAVVAA